MTLGCCVKPARSGSRAYDSNRSFCGHSEKALDLRNLYTSLSEMQTEDSGITSSHGIFSSSWPCCYDVCSGSQAVLAGQAKQLAFFFRDGAFFQMSFWRSRCYAAWHAQTSARAAQSACQQRWMGRDINELMLASLTRGNCIFASQLELKALP